MRLQFAFEVLCETEPLLKDAKLEITMVEPKSRCLDCGKEFRHDRFHVTCPECGGFAELIEGKDLRIESIEVDLPDDREERRSERAFWRRLSGSQRRLLVAGPRASKCLRDARSKE